MSGGAAPAEVRRPISEEVVEPDVPWIVIVWNDPIEELEYERKVGDSLLAAKLEQLTILERCVGSRVLSEEDVLACMRAVNDLRLVLGTRLDVREDSDPSEFAGDPERRSTFELYAYLSWLLESLIDAMSGSGS